MFYPLGKNSEKPYGGGGDIHHPLPLYVQWFKDTSLNNHQVTLSFALKRNEFNI